MKRDTANNYVYILDGRAYVNLTNKCHNACAFCIRNTGSGVKGVPLWLEKEPTADDVMTAFERVRDRLSSREVVFCGFGEPTEALGVLIETAKRFKALGYSTRLNTNGLGSLVAGRDIVPELKDIDTVSISLNECDAQKYAAVTRSAFGNSAFGGIIEFAKACVAAGIKTVFTVVDTIGKDDIAACAELSESLGVPLRVREYIPDNYGKE